MQTSENFEAKNELLLTEIDQYHAVVKDFSHQSTSIKKLSITIYVSFLTLYYTVGFGDMPSMVFFIIGLAIPIFCYIYEIYIDNIRQKTRVKMNDKIVEYESYNSIVSERKRIILLVKIFFIKFPTKRCGSCCLCQCSKKCDNADFLYVNVFHGMYLIYLIEVIITIVAGVL